MAETISRQALQFQEKVLGKEHPDTLTNTNNLVLFLVHQGKFAEAKAICWETLQLREKVLGKKHPATLTSKATLQYCLQTREVHKDSGYAPAISFIYIIFYFLFLYIFIFRGLK